MPFEYEKRIPEDIVIRDNLFSNNIGNQLFFNSVVRSLNCEYNSIFHYGYGCDSPEKMDRFVIPFANNIRNYACDEYEKVFELLRKTDKPFVISGVGTDSDSNFNTKLNDEIVSVVSEFYKEVLRRTESIGVRGEHTKKVLVEKCNIPTDKIDVIGCPSVRYYGNSLKRPSFSSDFSDESRIAVCFTAYHYDNDEAIFLYNILKNYKNSFVFFTDKVEAEMLRNGKEITDQNRLHDLLPTRRDHFIIREGRARFIPYQADLMKCFNSFSFLIGSRIHMVIAAILSGIPAMLIAHSTRVKEIADYHHIPYVYRNQLHEYSGVRELYYKALVDMNSFYDNYSKGLEDYRVFMEKNGLVISDSFK